MNRLYFYHCAGLVAALILLGGCGGQNVGPIPAAKVETQARHAKASSGDLLYVADGGTNYSGAYVLVYTYPQGKHVATLTGYHRLAGECSDSQGNVFVVAPGEESSNPSTIYEFAHGGSQPIATLTESGIAYGCAVDPTTGNLAVANYTDAANPNKGSGDVAIFSGAMGSATMYYGSELAAFFYCGFDDAGNLYLSQETANGNGLAVLRVGSGSLQTLKLKTTLFDAYAFEPSVQWDGSEMTVSSTLKQGPPDGNSGPVQVYQLSISGNTATVIGSTILNAKPQRHR